VNAPSMPTTPPLTRWAWLASWSAQIVMAVILGQTLFFKLTYAPETRYIFAKLGGRPAATFAALVEAVCVVLLLYPKTPAVGALLALGTMGGAVLTHLFVVGIVIPDAQTGQGDGGLLFGLALTVASLALIVLWLRRDALFAMARSVASR
jgi:hypothetical protein